MVPHLSRRSWVYKKAGQTICEEQASKQHYSMDCCIGSLPLVPSLTLLDIGDVEVSANKSFPLQAV